VVADTAVKVDGGEGGDGDVEVGMELWIGVAIGIKGTEGVGVGAAGVINIVVGVG
jgi:hypothetical protein